jgi:hypothetical protein
MRIALTTAGWLALILLGSTGLALVCACGSWRAERSPDAAAAADLDAGAPVVILPDDPAGTDDGGTLDPMDDAAGAIDADSRAPPDAPPGPPFDAGGGGICPGEIAEGDLVIDELMIAAVAGTGDHGEWLEVKSTRDCALDLRGLRGECPNGAHVYAFDVTEDVWLPPRGTFVVADSSDPALNHSLPGRVLQWSGGPGDVLRNKGGTVALRANGALIDTLTYPARPLTVGTSLAFPDDCPASARLDTTRWQSSAASFFPSFFGTPNATNADIRCR